MLPYLPKGGKFPVRNHLHRSYSLAAQRLKCLPGMRETPVRSLSWEDSLEKEMSTHSSNLAWRIPWREDPGRLQSMGLQRVGHDWMTSLHYAVSKIPSVINMSMGRAKQRLMTQRLKQQKRQIQYGVRDAELLQTRGKKGIQGLQGSGGLSTEKPCRILLGFNFFAISASPCDIWHLHIIHLNLKSFKPFWMNFGPKWRHRHKSLVNSPSTTDTSNLCLCTKAITPEINLENSFIIPTSLSQEKYPLITCIKMGVNCNPK